MLRFLRALLGGSARALGWCWRLGEAVGSGAWGAVRETLWPSPPPSNGMGAVVEAIRECGLGQAQATVERAVERRPAKRPVAPASMERALQERALRYTASVMHGGERPSLDGLPDALARRLARLRTPAEIAPVHRELVKATGRECRDGWWSGRPDDDHPGPVRAMAYV